MTHHMSDWEQKDLPNGVVGRVCEHGLVHPDPEDLLKKAKSGGFMANIKLAHHECDGCCVDLRGPDEKLHQDLSG